MTFIGYPDIAALSPNGKLRLEIRGNRTDKYFRDQADFSYHLLNSQSHQEIWSWTPAKEKELFDPSSATCPQDVGYADYPHDAWVNDEGWVVARLHEWFNGGLLVLSPEGRCKMLRPLQQWGDGEPGILEADVAYIGGTSAGPNWEASSIAAFHEHLGQPYWSILTWWGRRLVIDLQRGTLVEEVPTQQQTAAAQQERLWIMERLKLGITNMVEDNIAQPEGSERRERYCLQRQVYTAAYHAGRKKIRDADVLLRELEPSLVTGYSTSKTWFSVQFLPLRFIAKLSLLQLGCEPRWYANFQLTNRKPDSVPSYPKQSLNRRPDMISKGMSQREILAVLGPPEFLTNQWEYCFLEDDKAFALRVYWRNRHEYVQDEHGKWHPPFQDYLKAVEREPPIVEEIAKLDLQPWSVDGMREYMIAHRG